MGLIKYSCGHISGPHEPIHVNLVCEGFSSYSTDIWLWNCWNAKTKADDVTLRYSIREFSYVVQTITTELSWPKEISLDRFFFFFFFLFCFVFCFVFVFVWLVLYCFDFCFVLFCFVFCDKISNSPCHVILLASWFVEVRTSIKRNQYISHKRRKLKILIFFFLEYK